MPDKKTTKQYHENSGGISRLRADHLLVEKGLARSRARARQLILDGAVSVDGDVLSKPSRMLPLDATPVLTGADMPWVSRGALKLLGGLEAFPDINPKDCVCLDVGASTGGFTEVLLSRGAARVFAVDVGHDQLHPRLRDDPRVTVMEGVNARDLDAGSFDQAPEVIVCDASFISLTKVLPAALALAPPRAHLLALIKPQFEVGRGRVGKGGVVRDPELHSEACAAVEKWVRDDMGWHHIGTIASPVTGPDGNKEFLIAARNV